MPPHRTHVAACVLAAWVVSVAARPALGQGRAGPAESREARQTRAVEPYAGTPVAGTFVALTGLVAAGRGLWNLRPAFRGGSPWLKAGAIALVLAGLAVAAIGFDLARA